jgi:hypothetical protein
MFCAPPIDTLMSVAFSPLRHEFHHQPDQARWLAKHLQITFAQAFGISGAQSADR